ncbi:trans-sialidase, putative, partial [Trypanosoma cruzi]
MLSCCPRGGYPFFFGLAVSAGTSVGGCASTFLKKHTALPPHCGWLVGINDFWFCSGVLCTPLACPMCFPVLFSPFMTHTLERESKQALIATVKLEGTERTNNTHTAHTHIYMLSRVAAVKAPRTHSCRRVTGSSGRRREGGESEPPRPNMSRRVFTSAVLLLVVMMCCGTGGATKAEEPLSGPKFEWKGITDDVNVDSLSVPSLVEVGSDVFAVAEAQCKKDGSSGFTGIASQLLTNTADNKPEEVLKNAKEKTQVLEEFGSGKATKVDVSRPTTAVVDESKIYMLVGKHSHDD